MLKCNCTTDYWTVHYYNERTGLSKWVIVIVALLGSLFVSGWLLLVVGVVLLYPTTKGERITAASGVGVFLEYSGLFIPATVISDVCMFETFTKGRVVWQAALILVGDRQLIPIFNEELTIEDVTMLYKKLYLLLNENTSD